MPPAARRSSVTVAPQARRPQTPPAKKSVSVRNAARAAKPRQIEAIDISDDDPGDSASSESKDLANPGTLSTEVHDLPNEFHTQSSVVVEQPPEGFFLQGSSIEEMNGVYMKNQAPIYDEDEEDVETLLYYKHVDNLWTFEQLRRGRRYEWNLVDPDGNDR